MAKHSADQSIRDLEKKYQKRIRKKKLLRFLHTVLQKGLFLAVLLVFSAVLLWNQRSETVPPEGLLVYVLDVGQGDSVLLRSEGHAALIDAGDGTQGQHLVSMLKALDIRHLDYIINSHPHADHMGGMAAVLKNIPADVLILADYPQELAPEEPSFRHMLEAAQEQQIPVRTAECHETLSLGTAEIRLLCVENEGFSDLNDCSVGCRVTCGKHSFFFAGDLSAEGEKAMLEAGLIQPADVLKVSHHGSSSSSTEDFLKVLSPDIAVVSAGAANDYGHPSVKTVERLRNSGCEVYRTDLDGTVLLASDGEVLRVYTAAEPKS